MPVIVDEVVISVEVANQSGGGARGKPVSADNKQEIVAQCVERVLEIIEQREER
jgi:hypothetical protein